MVEGPDPSDLGLSWPVVRDRIFRFARNIVRLERTIDRLVHGQARDRKDLNELLERMRKIEAQHELIIRLLERDRSR